MWFSIATKKRHARREGWGVPRVGAYTSWEQAAPENRPSAPGAIARGAVGVGLATPAPRAFAAALLAWMAGVGAAMHGSSPYRLEGR